MSAAGSLTLAAGSVAWNNGILPRLGLSARARAMVNAAVGVGAVGALRTGGYTSGELGLTRSTLPSGVRWGVGVGLIPLVGYVVALAVPVLRAQFVGDGRDSSDFAEWVSFQIPVGTVLAEELLFRSALVAVSDRDGPPGPAAAVRAMTFGLWHVHPARAAGDSVAGTVLATGLSALMFDWLRRRSGSVLAPALVHLSINVGAAAAARAASARTVD